MLEEPIYGNMTPHHNTQQETPIYECYKIKREEHPEKMQEILNPLEAVLRANLLNKFPF